MVDETVPHEQSEAVADAQQAYSFLDVGVVTSAPDQTEDGAHHVTVAETRVPSDTPVPVIPPVHGDYYVPPEGTPVLLAYVEENDPVVIGSPLPPTDSENVTAGERVVSHPLSQAAVTFADDGGVSVVGDNGNNIAIGADGTITLSGSGNEVELQTDGTVVINNGDRGAVTDVTIDETNAEGGATKLKISRNSTIRL